MGSEEKLNPSGGSITCLSRSADDPAKPTVVVGGWVASTSLRQLRVLAVFCVYVSNCTASWATGKRN